MGLGVGCRGWGWVSGVGVGLGASPVLGMWPMATKAASTASSVVLLGSSVECSVRCESMQVACLGLGFGSGWPA